MPGPEPVRGSGAGAGAVRVPALEPVRGAGGAGSGAGAGAGDGRRTPVSVRERARRRLGVVTACGADLLGPRGRGATAAAGGAPSPALAGGRRRGRCPCRGRDAWSRRARGHQAARGGRRGGGGESVLGGAPCTGVIGPCARYFSCPWTALDVCPGRRFLRPGCGKAAAARRRTRPRRSACGRRVCGGCASSSSAAAPTPSALSSSGIARAKPSAASSARPLASATSRRRPAAAASSATSGWVSKSLSKTTSETRCSSSAIAAGWSGGVLVNSTLVLDPKLVRQLAQLRFVGAGADDQQPRLGLALKHVGEGGDHPVMTLVALQPADRGEDRRPLGLAVGSGRSRRRRGRSRWGSGRTSPAAGRARRRTPRSRSGRPRPAAAARFSSGRSSARCRPRTLLRASEEWPPPWKVTT